MLPHELDDGDDPQDIVPPVYGLLNLYPYIWFFCDSFPQFLDSKTPIASNATALLFSDFSSRSALLQCFGSELAVAGLCAGFVYSDDKQHHEGGEEGDCTDGASGKTGGARPHA